MLNVNRVTLLGHVGRDPELHNNAGGPQGMVNVLAAGAGREPHEPETSGSRPQSGWR